MARMIAFVLQAWRYGLAGLVNTALGFGVMVTLDRVFATPPALANAAGFAVGTVTGFLLSRRFVFRSNAPPRTTAPRYLMTVTAGFALNQVVLAGALAALSGMAFAHEIAQLIAVATYTLCVFLTCRFWVFRQPIDPVIATV